MPLDLEGVDRLTAVQVLLCMHLEEQNALQDFE
jgi:hypothetical protein